MKKSLIAAAFAVIAIAIMAMMQRDDGAGNGMVLSVVPAAASSDSGPTSIVGGENEATQFIAADLYVSGKGNCRVYFDRRDNRNFHFMDRDGKKVSIGLCEAGLEQIFTSGALPKEGDLRIARHGAHIAVFQNGELIVSAFDDRLLGGSAGFRMAAGAQPIDLKVEPRDDVHFADDFMITETKSAQWSGNGDFERGDFSVQSLRHPLLSANAFSYMGVGSGIHSVVGKPWWDRYRYDVALRGPVNARMGLVFAYQDDRNFGLFRWSARKTDATGVTDAGKREIVRVRDGVEQVIASQSGGYLPDQWYGASVRMSYSHVTISIDGHTLMEAADPCLTSGGAGVWCDVPLPATVATAPKAQAFQENSLNELMKQHACFDDVRINTVDGFEDDFRQAGPLKGGWLVGTGDWSVRQKSDKAAASVGELSVVPGNGLTKALIGDRRWAQYEIEADVLPGSGPAGVVFLHRDESNYYYSTVDDKLLRLISVVDGKEEIVDSVPLAKVDGTVHLKTTIKHGHVRVIADNATSVEHFVGDTFLKGRAGFVAASQNSGKASVFSRFRLSFLPEAEPLVTSNAIFEDELTMNEWTSPSSEWYPPKEQLLVEGRPVNLLWHRSQFPGDVELVVEPREFPDPKYELALSLAKDGQGKNNGYVFRFRAGDASDGASRVHTLQLYRQGKVVKEKALEDESGQLSSLAIRKCGKYIVGVVNGRAVISFKDDAPLSGSKVAYYTQGVLVRTEATKIVSDNFRNDLFSRAPIAWRTAGAAIAEVTNRWQCDPRWSFFSLKNDLKKGKPAVLWSKYLYPGDVTVEFFVANKMEGERGQPYTYARDINVTICSDGSDLTKGYTFMYGGQNNTASMILRDGVEVKRIGRTIDTTMNSHRHWFAFKVEKQGNRLSFRVDRYFADEKNKTSDLVYEDSMPLTGGHVAVWTYNHAIMISRVRISGDGGNIAVEPDWQPAPLKTPYDDQ